VLTLKQAEHQKEVLRKIMVKSFRGLTAIKQITALLRNLSRG
jgi:hypothetical protein